MDLRSPRNGPHAITHANRRVISKAAAHCSANFGPHVRAFCELQDARATPHISHFAPFVYGMKDRQTRRRKIRKGRAVGFALLLPSKYKAC
jgi:hypothetical protein